jgi:hypothetical protein
MTKDELLRELARLRDEERGDPEVAHSEADDALLEYINDVDITEAFGAIEKWYA